MPKDARSSVWRVVFDGATDKNQPINATVTVSCEPGATGEVAPTLPQGVKFATCIRRMLHEK